MEEREGGRKRRWREGGRGKRGREGSRGKEGREAEGREIKASLRKEERCCSDRDKGRERR